MLRIIDVKFLISDEHNSIENEFNGYNNKFSLCHKCRGCGWLTVDREREREVHQQSMRHLYRSLTISS